MVKVGGTGTHALRRACFIYTVSAVSCDSWHSPRAGGGAHTFRLPLHVLLGRLKQITVKQPAEGGLAGWGRGPNACHVW